MSKYKEWSSPISYPKGRYLCHDGRWMMFHSEVYPNIANKKARKKIPAYWTDHCNKLDEVGFCRGHKMTREEFIDYAHKKGWDKERFVIDNTYLSMLL